MRQREKWTVYYAVDSRNYLSQILNLKSKSIEGAILFAGGGDCINFLRQGPVPLKAGLSRVRHDLYDVLKNEIYLLESCEKRGVEPWEYCKGKCAS